MPPDDGTEKLFFHVSSVMSDARRGLIGDIVVYSSVRDSWQRFNAQGVFIDGVSKG